MFDSRKPGLAKTLPPLDQIRICRELGDAFADLCDAVEEAHETAHELEKVVSQVLYGDAPRSLSGCCSPLM